MDFTFKQKYNMDDLLEIMRILRAPGGCPWDAEQNHATIRKNLIEETYETVDAIDRNDLNNLKEELGDVLLQVVFHSQMEAEAGTFDFNDVADGICKKLIHRHPHVFSDVQLSTSEEVLKNWDNLKKQEKNEKNLSNSMKSLSFCLPSLMKSDKIQTQASKIGFDWANIWDIWVKVEEEIRELKEAILLGDPAHIEEELGDILFVTVNISRLLKVDAEQALSKSCDKFIRRFMVMEVLAEKKGISLEDAPLSQMDEFWDQAKLLLKARGNLDSRDDVLRII